MKIPQVDISSLSLTGAWSSPRPLEQPLSDADLTALASVAQQLDSAFSLCGFVHLTNYDVAGIPADLVERALAQSARFFRLPDEVKDKLATTLDRQHGYVSQGREVFSQNENGSKALHEARESYDVKSLAPGAFFPDQLVPDLRSSLTELASKTHSLIYVILRAMALALGQEDVDFFVKNHQRVDSSVNNASKIRSLYYPPLLGEVPPGVVRCGAHTDYGSLAFLYPDMMGGLELRSVAGEWVAVDPVANSIVLNVGDLMEMYSNGRYPATLHRVAVPAEELRRKTSRQSMVFFVHPDGEQVVRNLLDKEEDKYPPVVASDHVKKRFQETFKY